MAIRDENYNLPIHVPELEATMLLIVHDHLGSNKKQIHNNKIKLWGGGFKGYPHLISFPNQKSMLASA